VLFCSLLGWRLRLKFGVFVCVFEVCGTFGWFVMLTNSVAISLHLYRFTLLCLGCFVLRGLVS